MVIRRQNFVVTINFCVVTLIEKFLKKNVVDPQFFPSTLAFIYGCHTHPSFSYGTVRVLLGLVSLQALGGLVCGPLSAYVVIGIMP